MFIPRLNQEYVVNVPNADDLLNVEEAATYLHVKRLTIYDLSSAGKITKQKVGSKVLFRRSDLDDYIEEKKRKRIKSF